MPITDRRSFLRGLVATIAAPLVPAKALEAVTSDVCETLHLLGDPLDIHLIRSVLWSRAMKQILLDELFAMKFVSVLPTEALDDPYNLERKEER